MFASIDIRQRGMHEMRRIPYFARAVFVALLAITELPLVPAWMPGSTFGTQRCTFGHQRSVSRVPPLSNAHSEATAADVTVSIQQPDQQSVFEDFVEFLLHQQTSIINEIERTIEKSSGEQFGRDGWGMFANQGDSKPGTVLSSGGITRVIQHGHAIEKGACSFTVLRNGILSAERAESIQSRQSSSDIQAGDMYSAVALSMVLHSRNPMVPTFRSDVRMFQVRSSQNNQTITWLGGGADLTPYYLHRPDIASFHRMYSDLCTRQVLDPPFSYANMKQACDDYFYLPARQEHRGTGGIFFDDLPVDFGNAIPFVKEMTQTWMPSWIPIVQARNDMTYNEEQKHWQKLRRGRYLEFNLLYDVRVECMLVV
jgi:coproporphyrinogen III oxidase